MTLSSPRHASRGVAVGASLAICLLAVSARPAWANDILPTSPLTDGFGKTVGFATTEPSLYFLQPSGWSLLEGARTPPVRLTQVQDGCNLPCHPGGNPSYDLRLVLTPDYGHAAPAVVSVLGQDPEALFFPLPSTIQRVTLFLPPVLGGIQAQLVPDEEGLATPVAIYYRLRVDSVQLGILRQLAQGGGGLVLQGTVQYDYLAPGGFIQQTAAPLTVWLEQSELAVSTAPPPDPTAWLGDLLATTTMSVPGAIDGPYSLGGGIAVQITNSLVEGHFLPGTWALSHDGVSTIQLVPTVAPDFTGSISFDVPSLGFHIRADYRATVSVALDLLFMQVTLPQFNLTNVTINGSSSPFYTLLLRNLMSSASVRDKVAASVTEELQRRILSQTLFGLGDILP